jgi:F0F1-type ATP synthase membrane subunit c/vacuolar-type H+-ATPase subunit K
MNQYQPKTNVEGRLRVVRIIWAAFLMSVLMYFVLGYFFLREPEPKNIEATEVNIFLGPLLIASLISVFFSFSLKKRFMSKATNEHRPDMIQTAIIISFAMCEVAALFGLLTIFLTGSALS